MCSSSVRAAAWAKSQNLVVAPLQLRDPRGPAEEPEPKPGEKMGNESSMAEKRMFNGCSCQQHAAKSFKISECMLYMLGAPTNLFSKHAIYLQMGLS